MNTNNKIIAEFMGMNIVNFKGIEYVENAGNLNAHLVDDLEAFSFDWNWLMEVVNKCLEICHTEMLNEWEIGFSDSFFSRDINCMYSEAVRFIKWYNLNK